MNPPILPGVLPTADPSAKGIERMAREARTITEKPTAEYLQIDVKTVLNRCTSPRVPFAWTINPYRGCEFGCRYCYARYTHEFMGMRQWEAFEEKIYVKRDAARLLAHELDPAKLRGQHIAVGTATDPYQPAERRFKVTRAILEVLALGSDLRLSITTKGDLVTRDLDVLARIQARSRITVNMTVTTLDRRLARILEYRAPTPQLRLAAVKALRAAGIPAGVSIAPILPDITDSRANLDAVIAAAQACDATHVWANVVFLKPCAQQAFFAFLAQHFPHLRDRYAARFARSAFVRESDSRRILDLVSELKTRHGFRQHEIALPDGLHEAASESEQLPLLHGQT